VALTPEEKRQRDRERQARYRAERRAKPKLAALPQIGPASGADDVTPGVTAGVTGVTPGTNVAALTEMLAELTITTAQKPRVALLLTLAHDLDAPGALPQRASISTKYDEQIDKLLAATKPKERDELDEMRMRFYQGETGGIDDDPEARGRPSRRKKA
jgi:hypothetical protein